MILCELMVEVSIEKCWQYRLLQSNRYLTEKFR